MYQPILKGKKAEFEAWKNVSTRRRPVVTPLFEIVADKGLTADLEKFRDGLTGSAQPGDTVAVDALPLGGGAIEPSSGLGTYSWLAQELNGEGFAIQPVLHLDDGAPFIADAIAAFGADNIVLRVGGTEGDPHPSTADTSLASWCQTAGLNAADVHLLIDFASIYGLDPAAQQGMANAYLAWAAANGHWASVTLASGAFPTQITSLPKSAANSIPRSDAALWNLVHQTSPVPELRFGDYGVRHPDLPDGPAWNGPLPNLRYAADTEWVVWREAKLAQNPHDSFYEVCRNIVSLPQYSGAQFSWGDTVINQKSQKIPGPGAGAEWITYGMNRHIEFVADRLTNHRVA